MAQRVYRHDLRCPHCGSNRLSMKLLPAPLPNAVASCCRCARTMTQIGIAGCVAKVDV